MRPLFEQLKDGTLRHVGGKLVTGVVSFPSYHAAAGLLFVWALWPLRWLKWPILIFNLLMLASALTIGSHYLIDLVAGLVVGFMSIPIAGKLQGWFSRRELRNPVVG